MLIGDFPVVLLEGLWLVLETLCLDNLTKLTSLQRSHTQQPTQCAELKIQEPFQEILPRPAKSC